MDKDLPADHGISPNFSAWRTAMFLMAGVAVVVTDALHAPLLVVIGAAIVYGYQARRFLAEP